MEILLGFHHGNVRQITDLGHMRKVQAGDENFLEGRLGAVEVDEF